MIGKTNSIHDVLITQYEEKPFHEFCEVLENIASCYYTLPRERIDELFQKSLKAVRNPQIKPEEWERFNNAFLQIVSLERDVERNGDQGAPFYEYAYQDDITKESLLKRIYTIECTANRRLKTTPQFTPIVLLLGSQDTNKTENLGLEEKSKFTIRRKLVSEECLPADIRKIFSVKDEKTLHTHVDLHSIEDDSAEKIFMQAMNKLGHLEVPNMRMFYQLLPCAITSMHDGFEKLRYLCIQRCVEETLDETTKNEVASLFVKLLTDAKGKPCSADEMNLVDDWLKKKHGGLSLFTFDSYVKEAITTERGSSNSGSSLSSSLSSSSSSKVSSPTQLQRYMQSRLNFWLICQAFELAGHLGSMKQLLQSTVGLDQNAECTFLHTGREVCINKVLENKVPGASVLVFASRLFIHSPTKTGTKELLHNLFDLGVLTSISEVIVVESGNKNELQNCLTAINEAIVTKRHQIKKIQVVIADDAEKNELFQHIGRITAGALAEHFRLLTRRRERLLQDADELLGVVLRPKQQEESLVSRTKTLLKEVFTGDSLPFSLDAYQLGASESEKMNALSHFLNWKEHEGEIMPWGTNFARREIKNRMHSLS